jgi:hypothetical protein
MGLKLIGEVTLDGAGFERGLQRIGTTAASNLKNFVVGAFGIYGIQQAITKTVESCTELVNASSKLGMTVEQLQVMRQAAKEGGVEFENMVKAANRLAAIRMNIIQGGKGSDTQLASLGRLGVTPDMVRTMTATAMMQGPISQTVKTVNPADIANDMKEIFSKSWGDMIPVLKTNFGSLEAKMRSFGMIIDSTTARELKMFGDQIGLITGIITTGLAPWLVRLGEALFDLSKWFATAGTYYGTLVTDWMHGIFKGSNKDAVEQAQQTYDTWTATWKNFQDKAKNPPTTAPPTIPEELPPPKEEKLHEWKPTSDALISVGNFLGAGRGAIGSVAEQHLAVAREQLGCLKSIDNKLDSQSGGSGGDDNGIDYGN